jgi:serine protease Do
MAAPHSTWSESPLAFSCCLRALLGTVVALVLAAGASAAQSEPQRPAPAQPAPQQPAPGGCPESLPALYDQLSPAVVAISGISINPYDMDNRIERVGGSGVIIEASGLILTNSHVVFGRQVITVTLDDGTSLPAKLIGADPIFDIALVKIPPPSKGSLPVAKLGDSSRLLVGVEVYAIGNPLGLEQTLTRGIVSAVDRLMPGAAWSLAEPMIQTDASINPGNSGGPLLDPCGHVIGITTAIMPGAQNIGFAVPVDLVKEVIPRLLSKGRVIRPWLGVQGQFVLPGLKELLRVPLVDGFLIESVEPGSPAENGGLRGGMFELTIEGQPILLGGDILTHINGKVLDDARALATTLGELEVGSRLKMTVVRDGKPQTVELTLAERPVLPWDLPGRRSSNTPPRVARRRRAGRARRAGPSSSRSRCGSVQLNRT